MQLKASKFRYRSALLTGLCLWLTDIHKRLVIIARSFLGFR